MEVHKRSIRGYSPASVRQAAKELQEDHRLRMQGLQEELEALQTENAARRAELERFDRLEPSCSPDLAEDRKRADRLYEMHLEQTKAIAELRESVKQAVFKQREQLEQLEAERRKAIEEVEEQLLLLLKRLPGKEGVQ